MIEIDVALKLAVVAVVVSLLVLAVRTPVSQPPVHDRHTWDDQP